MAVNQVESRRDRVNIFSRPLKFVFIHLCLGLNWALLSNRVSFFVLDEWGLSIEVFYMISSNTMELHKQSVSKILDSSQARLHLTTVEYISMLLEFWFVTYIYIYTYIYCNKTERLLRLVFKVKTSILNWMCFIASGVCSDPVSTVLFRFRPLSFTAHLAPDTGGWMRTWEVWKIYWPFHALTPLDWQNSTYCPAALLPDSFRTWQFSLQQCCGNIWFFFRNW